MIMYFKFNLNLTVPILITQFNCTYFNLMLKQYNVSSGLSSKTLSRQKFINRTTQQTHNISIQSGKQVRTLRNQHKNKSCFISKHLAQSTESHIISSNEKQSQKCKSTIKNYSTENLNPNISRTQYQIQARKSLVQSNFIRPFVNLETNSFKQNNMLCSNQPYLSLPPEVLNMKNNILQYNTNYVKENPFVKIKNINLLPLNDSNNPNIMLRQKLLEKQVKEMFLYKNKQLTKGLQQMHRFCICVKELKWICQEVHLLVKKYNQEIKLYYKEYFLEFKKKSDLENIAKESEELLKRFNQIESLNGNQKSLLNFNLPLNQQAIDSSPSKHLAYQANSQIISSNNKNSQLSVEYPNSWSKLIKNIQQQQQVHKENKNKPGIALNDQNKNISIGTFQITENSSPYRNKTLNELIRLSELRKTQFMDSFGTDNKENNPNNNNLQQCKENEKSNNKKGVYDQVPKQKLGEKDPFDSIHLPHFSTKNESSHLLQTQKLYEQEIYKLKRQLQNRDIENNQYFRKLRQKSQQLEKQNQTISRQLHQKDNRLRSYCQKATILLEKALKELINSYRTTEPSITQNMLGSFGVASEKSKTQQLSKSQPSFTITNKSFFELVNSLEAALKFCNSSNSQADSYYQEIIKSINPTQQQRQGGNTISLWTKIKNEQTKLNQLQREMSKLSGEVKDLSKIKCLLQNEIIKLQAQFRSLQQHKQSYGDHQLKEMLFTQAFTIEELLQLQNQNQGPTYD